MPALSPILRLPASLIERGRVFVVGDVHGCYDLLMQALEAVNLDPARDTLICVGDLIDRGPDSAKCLQFLRETFVYAVRGNHEDMLLGAQECHNTAGNFMLNGGRWWLDTDASLHQPLLDIAQSLPLAIELETPLGRMGFVHAEVPRQMPWATFVDAIERGDDRAVQTALWGRGRISSQQTEAIDGIERLYVGHTPLERPMILGNIHYLDTGAVFNGVPGSALTLANVLADTQAFLSSRVDDRLRLIF